MAESSITKRAIAQGLKNLMRRKGFDKITIGDIAQECGLNRQTFYYHFQDKYELLNWIYYNEIILVLERGISLSNWNERFLAMLQKMKQDGHFYCNMLRSSSHGEFKEYLYSTTRELFLRGIDLVDRSKSILPEEREFIASFYSYGIVGTILEWAQNGMQIPPETVAIRVKSLVHDSKKFALFETAQDCRLPE